MKREEKRSPRAPRPEEIPSGEEIRRQLVAEVRRKLLAGELDTEVAALETALALLDGDTPYF